MGGLQVVRLRVERQCGDKGRRRRTATALGISSETTDLNERILMSMGREGTRYCDQPGRFGVAFNSLVATTFLLPIYQVWLRYANVPAFKPHPIQPPLRHRQLR